MKSSARNVYHGVVSEIRLGEVNAEISLQVSATTNLVAVITRQSVITMGLHIGRQAFALVNSSSPVLIEPSVDGWTSARNRVVGQVVAIHCGELSTEVALDIGDGKTLVALASSVERLKYQPGDRLCALIKASQVILGTE